MRLFLRGIGVAAALGAAALFGGCGSDVEASSSSGGGPTGVSVDQLAPKYAAVLCSTIETCFGPLAVAVTGPSDCAAEREREITDDFVPRLKGYIEAGTVIYRPDKVQACLDAIEAEGCDLLGGVVPDICEDALEGKVANGASCNDGVECIGDDFCAFNNGACPGTCTARQGENAACTENGECAIGLSCQSDAIKAGTVCKKPADIGQACKGVSAPDCQPGAACVGETATVSGACKWAKDLATQGAGQSCDPGKESFCQESLSCVVDNFMMQTFKCAAVSVSGGTCRAGVPDPCPSGEYCNFDPATGSPDGICNKLPTDGQACADNPLKIGPSCAAGHLCDGTSTCRARQLIGGTCTEDDVCYSRTCDNGKCVAPPACNPNN